MTKTQVSDSSFFETLAWLVVFVTAIYVRLTSYSRVFVGNEVRFGSGDSFLHIRRILLTVKSFPSVANFDNYNGFPDGMSINWPPLWDFIPSAMAVILGMGHPAEQLVLRVSAVFPVIVGLLTFIPLASLARSVFGQRAVWPTLMIAAVLPPMFEPTLLGAIDHHGGVVFFVVSILALVAWSLSGENKKLAGRKDFITFTVTLSLAIAGSILTWLGFVLFLGFVWAYSLISSIISKGNDRRVFASIGIAYLLAGLEILPFCFAANQRFTYTYLSLFHLVFLLGTGITLLGITYVIYHLRPKPKLVFIFAGVLGLPAFLLIWTLFPNLKEVFVNGVIKAFALYPWGQITSEWHPLLAGKNGLDFSTAESVYSKAFFVLPIAAVLAIIWQRRRRSNTLAVWFFATWGIVSFILALQVVIFWQFFGVTAAVLFGVGTLAAWDLGSRYLGNFANTFTNQALPPAIPAVIVLVLLCGTSVSNVWERLYASNFYDLNMWIRNNTPQTGGLYDTATKPEYGILSNWEFGDAIATIAQRPAVADGNNETNLAGFVLAQSIFQSQDEDAAVKLMEENRLRYTVVGAYFTYFDGNLWLAGPPEGSTQNGSVPKPRKLTEIPPNLADSLILSRLFAIGDDRVEPLNHFRILYAGSDGAYPAYVYEMVNGAAVMGQSEPSLPISAILTIRTTNNNQFRIRYRTLAGLDGKFQLTLPYATAGRMGDTSAVGFYTVTDSRRSGTLQITEQQVKNGDQVNFSFGGLS